MENAREWDGLTALLRLEPEKSAVRRKACRDYSTTHTTPTIPIEVLFEFALATKARVQTWEPCSTHFCSGQAQPPCPRNKLRGGAQPRKPSSWNMWKSSRLPFRVWRISDSIKQKLLQATVSIMPPTGNAYDVDWVCSLNSNTHIANDLAWFTTFTPFSTAICTDLFNDADCRIVGLGDVTLPVETCRELTGSATQSTIVLRDVCYAPSSFCNILGGEPTMIDYELKIQGGWSLADKDTGGTTAIFDRLNGLFRLRLKGQSSGQSSLANSGAFMIYAGLPSSELERWKHYKRSRVGSIIGKAGYTTESYFMEGQQWLRKNSLSEVQFLRAHGLSIDKDEDRDEGRNILRGLMLGETAPSRGGRSDVGGRYTEGEKRWLKENWGNEFLFLRAYGMSKDREAGRKLVRAFVLDQADGPCKLYPYFVTFIRTRRWIVLFPMQSNRITPSPLPKTLYDCR